MAMMHILLKHISSSVRHSNVPDWCVSIPEQWLISSALQLD